MSDKIEVEKVNHSGHITRVDAVKYAAAKRALLAILSGQEQGVNTNRNDGCDQGSD